MAVLLPAVTVDRLATSPSPARPAGVTCSDAVACMSPTTAVTRCTPTRTAEQPVPLQMPSVTEMTGGGGSVGLSKVSNPLTVNGCGLPADTVASGGLTAMRWSGPGLTVMARVGAGTSAATVWGP